MLKELFQKGKCKIGFHEGEWKYEFPQKCSEIRDCCRCGKRSKRVSHIWDSWEYMYKDECTQIRLCKRCGEEEFRTEHNWGEWKYEAGSCMLFRICKKCSEREKGLTEHLWDHFEYKGSDSCLQVQVCKRCGAKSQNEKLNHNWGEWTYSESKKTSIRVCRRCGEMEMR